MNHEQSFLKWISQYGSSAEIFDPFSVREKFKEQLKRWRHVYGDS
ncbi:WYL domain-containing protein [Paenibacillus alvei]|nr:WYL domain-containing protein [Paenibacillus alvei]